MYKKILYPIKFEEFSLDILSCVTNFKKTGTTEIILLHVIDVSRLPMDRYEGYSEIDVKKWIEIANTKMAEAEDIIKDAGLKVKKRIEVGMPYREILKVAKEENISLIVSGRQKKGIMGEIFIGSNTDKVIRYGNIPVYVPKYPAIFDYDKEACKRFCEKLFRKILYPTDWSDCAVETLGHLKKLKGAGIEDVIITHIMDEKAIRLQPDEKFREFERMDREKLQEVKNELGREGIKAKIRLDAGNPRSDLIKIAKEEDASLIVIGSHGKGYVRGILWGSVSRNVVEYSDRPVLLIKCE